MTLKPRKCPVCGAPVAAAASSCDYCGTGFEPSSPPPRPAAAAAASTPRAERAGRGEFGLRGGWPLLIGLAGAAALYALGWTYEDTRYWLDDTAIVIWAGALPLWLLLVSLVWRPRWGTWLAGLALALAVLAAHVAIMWILRGRLDDDHFAIAGIFAGAALGGWLLGRILHAVIRSARAKAA